MTPFFINHTKVCFRPVSEKLKLSNYDAFVLSLKGLKKAEGKVLLLGEFANEISLWLEYLEKEGKGRIKQLDCVVVETKKSEKILRNFYKLIEAAGGLVEKDGKVLMISRWGVWDFPKGKLEKGESVAEGALREVEEECQVKAKIREELPSTYHSYFCPYKKRLVLKRTYWFVMECLEDSKMKPQKEEDIEALKFMTSKEMKAALKESYPSLQWLGKQYLKKG